MAGRPRPRVSGYGRRLLGAGAAYQISDVVAKVLALALLPLYTRHLSRADYGTAELLLTAVILTSIVVRLGLGEALVRRHHLDADPQRRRRLARTALTTVAVTTTLAATVAALLASPISELVLGVSRPGVVRAAALGLWAFTNLELVYALLRVDERRRPYLVASVGNVALTVGLTVWLVVDRGEGALGLLLGNFGASAIVLLALWGLLVRSVFGTPDRAELRAMLRFGAPTVPAEMSVFLLFVVDRFWLFHRQGAAAAGLYALATKLAAGVIFTVRAFQLAWPPLAYSIADDEEARDVYARVATWYVAATGLVVAGIALGGRWVVRLFAAPTFYGAHRALPWVALGWALYGLTLVFVAMAGRALVTLRNAPAALCGLAANVALLALLVPRLGTAGAGIALAGAYVVMLAAQFALTRGLFPVAFAWRRMAVAAGACAAAVAAGELLAGTHGPGALALRAAIWLAAVPPALIAASRG